MVWPQPGEGLGRTIAAEQAVTGLFAEALRRWAPAARAAVLPALVASVLPPDPAAMAQTQTTWSQQIDEVINPGLAILWAAAAYEATIGIGGTVAVATPVAAEGTAAAIVLAALLLSRRQVEEALAFVDATPALKVARDEFLQSMAVDIATTPFRVQAKIETALSRVTRTVERETPRPQDTTDVGRVVPAVAAPTVRPSDTGAGNRSGRATHPTPSITSPGSTTKPTASEITVEIIPETRPEVLRVEAEQILDPTSPEMQNIAEQEGYQAAGVMNHAVLSAAEASAAELGEELDKAWIATLDAKTRDSHWAAWGQRMPIKAHFTVGGESMMYPGDESASPAEWKNCRCGLAILGKDEALPDEFDMHTERLDGRDSVVINRDGRTQQEEIDRRAAEGNVRARDDENGIGRVAAGRWAAPKEQEHGMGEFATDTDTQDVETFLTFSGYIGKLGVATSDRRILAADIELTQREFPQPMAWQKKASGGHSDSFTVGVVEAVEVREDRVWASGYFLNSPEAVEAAEQVKHRVSAPSLDLAAAEYVFTDGDGREIDGDLFAWAEQHGDPYAYFTKAEQTGFTLVQTPAFDGIDITLGERETRDLAVVAAVVAGVDGPQVKTYDPVLFADPKLTRATAPTMDNQTGRIYGHLAEWGHAIRGGRELTPRNHNGYSNFHTSQVQLDNGKQLSVGRLTVEGGHADTSPRVTVATARAHYDNVCSAFGLVRVGEDRFGIWFSGVPAPGVDPEVFQMGMTAPLSGDWRDCGGGLDMIAAHAVNHPGYPIYSAVTGPAGQDIALVASLGPSRKMQSVEGGFTLDRESLKTLLTEVVETVDQRRVDRDAALAHQSRVAAAVSRGRETVSDDPTELTATQRVQELLGLNDDTGVMFADPNPGRGMPVQFKKYWLTGAGAAKIRWGQSGDFDRCCVAINAKIVEHGKPPLPDHEIKGLCAKLHKEATGATPGHAPGEKHA